MSHDTKTKQKKVKELKHFLALNIFGTSDLVRCKCKYTLIQQRAADPRELTLIFVHHIRLCFLFIFLCNT